MTSTKDLFRIGYTYYPGAGQSVEGEVYVPSAMQLNPSVIKKAVAEQIANVLKQQGIFVWLDGGPIIAGTTNIAKASCQRINVDAVSCDSFELECYDQGAPIRPVLDN